MATLDGVLATDSDYSPRYGDTRWRAGYRQWLTLTALWRHSVACWLKTVKNTYRAMATLGGVLATDSEEHSPAMATLSDVLATESEEHLPRYGDTRWRAGYRQWRTLTALWRHSVACWLQTVKNTHRAMATLDGVLATDSEEHSPRYGDTRWRAGYKKWLFTALWWHSVACWLQKVTIHRTMAALGGVLATDSEEHLPRYGDTRWRAATDSEEHSPRYGDTRWRAGYKKWLFTALWWHSVACWLQKVTIHRDMVTLGGVLATDSEEHLPRYGDTRWRAGYRQWRTLTALWRHSVACWLQKVTIHRTMATLGGVLATDSEEHLPRYGGTRWRAGYRQWRTLTALWRHSVACWLQTVKNTYRAIATLGGVLATNSEEHLPRYGALGGVLATDSEEHLARYGDTRWRAGYKQWRTLTALWRHSMAWWLQTEKNTYRSMATLGGVLATDSEEHLQRYGDTRWRAGYRQWLTLTALWRHSMACWLQTVTNTHRAMATLDGVLATDQRAYRAMATLDGVVASEENTYRAMATLDGVLATDSD